MAHSPSRRKKQRIASHFVYERSPWAKGHGEVVRAPEPPADEVARVRGFARYAVLATAPVALWAASLGFDIAFHLEAARPPWLAIASENCIRIGLVLNLIAVFADLGGLTLLYDGTRAFRDTAYQLCLNVLVLSLYIQNEVIRNVQIHHDPRVTTVDFVLSLVALPLWVGVAYHGIRLLTRGAVDFARPRKRETGWREVEAPGSRRVA